MALLRVLLTRVNYCAISGRCGSLLRVFFLKVRKLKPVQVFGARFLKVRLFEEFDIE